MLFQVITQHPEAIGTILKNTPTWVWGLFAALVALGMSQIRDRSVSALRVALLPAGMSLFSIWGTTSAFATAPNPVVLGAVWLAAAAAAYLLTAGGRAAGRYDPTSRVFRLPGSYVPLALILAVFLTKYAVGVEIAMQPSVVRDMGFALPIAALYGAFSGLFAGRGARLWRLAAGEASGRVVSPSHAVPELNA
jgi:hypothetical protein